MDLAFNLYEVIALLGLAQSIYVLVFMTLRSERLVRAFIPTLFFTVLACVFFLGAAESRWENSFDLYFEMKWFLWTLLFPLSALLVLQISKITKVPAVKLWGIFLFIPCAYITSLWLGNTYGQLETWLYISGGIVGSISLLTIWNERACLDELYMRKNGKERYWLIISLVILNVALLVLNFFHVDHSQNFDMIRNIIGISFIYLASTSLFRIYPQAVSIVPDTDKKDDYLTDAEVDIAMKIENLLHLDKIYQEPSYKRSNLARELDVTDAYLSRIVNIYFEKSVPQLLNTYRVEDAKYLLKETSAEVAVISEEAGFNSIATFNRVFKEIAGVSPSEYRAKTH